MDLETLTALADLFGKVALLLLEYLKVAAWPVVVLTLALVYRRPLVSVLHRLRKAEGLGASFELEQDVAYIAAAAQAAASPASGPKAGMEDGSGDATAPEGESASSAPSGVSGTAAADGCRTEKARAAEQKRNVGDARRLALIRRALADEAVGLTRVQRRERMRQRWRELQDLAGSIGEELGLGPWMQTPEGVARELAALGYVSGGLVDIVQSLGRVHAMVVETPDDELFLTPMTVDSYSVAVKSVEEQMRQGVTEHRQYLEGQRPPVP